MSLLEMGVIPISSNNVKKCQQAFLASLPGKALVKRNLVGHVHGNV
jgi:hypothetical protein